MCVCVCVCVEGNQAHLVIGVCRCGLQSIHTAVVFVCGAD